MTLEYRCPRHPHYEGEILPGESEVSSQACGDCWELFRMIHAGESISRA